MHYKVLNINKYVFTDFSNSQVETIFLLHLYFFPYNSGPHNFCSDLIPFLFNLYKFSLTLLVSFEISFQSGCRELVIMRALYHLIFFLGATSVAP